MERIEVNTSADWELIRSEGLKVVVDPMVFRSADVFLRGRSGVKTSPDPKPDEKMWSAISSNIGSLCAFFDALILEERLPMYDYNYTFPGDIEEGKKALVDYCNSQDPVLVPVSVGDAAYQEMKTVAITQLDRQPPIPEPIAKEITEELTAFDWEWRPDLWREYGNTNALDAFQYGGLLFSAYARRIGADHILQPRRARLYLAASLCSRSNSEEELFAELTKRLNQGHGEQQELLDMPETPTFLPMLLKHDDSSPRELIERALKLRNSSTVKDYRKWKAAAMEEIEKGRLSVGLQREVAAIAAAAMRELKVDPDDSGAVKVKISGKILPVPELGVEAEVETANAASSLSWLLGYLPGRRYRKLLLRMVVAANEYRHIDRHLQQLWSQA